MVITRNNNGTTTISFNKAHFKDNEVLMTHKLDYGT